MTQPPDLKAYAELLSDLEAESEQVQAELDDLIGVMASVPPEERSAEEWGPSGRLTTRYLELSERQSEVGIDIDRVKKAMAALTPVTPPPGSATH